MRTDSQNFKEESAALASILVDLSNEDFKKVTLFKKWTINDVIGHLHLWNIAADLTLNKPAEFMKLMAASANVWSLAGSISP